MSGMLVPFQNKNKKKGLKIEKEKMIHSLFEVEKFLCAVNKAEKIRVLCKIY